MNKQVTITLPWPVKKLWQNRRFHWVLVARAKQVQRYMARALMNEAKRDLAKFNPCRYELDFDFHQPNAIKRDLQNMPATQKAAIDGIADALGVDDSEFIIRWPTEWADLDRPLGSVTVTIRAIPQSEWSV